MWHFAKRQPSKVLNTKNSGFKTTTYFVDWTTTYNVNMYQSFKL